MVQPHLLLRRDVGRRVPKRGVHVAPLIVAVTASRVKSLEQFPRSPAPNREVEVKEEKAEHGEPDDSYDHRADHNGDGGVHAVGVERDEVDEEVDGCGGEGTDHAGHEAEEEAVVALAYAVVDERAVVVHHLHAVVAH